MFKKNQYKKNLLVLFVLVFLSFQLSASDKNISFEPRVSEFVLKNTSSLIYQIKKRHGLGYESLENQIYLLDCNSEILLSPSLLEKKDPYAFNKYFQDKLTSCKKKNEEKTNLKTLLQDKEIYLIIAGESLKSPMSYFGHSLILFLDKKDFYFSPVISFSAPTENLTPLQQITEGGFSFIKAEINAVPLHQVIDYYSNKESRKLKFIKISHSIFDKDRLINHLNDQASRKLTYNFFTKNCSTYLYTALNYSCDCFIYLPTIVTPYLLEKNILEQKESSEIFEIDSLFDQFNKHYSSLEKNTKETVKKMFLSENSDFFNNDQAGEIAALASRLSFKSYQRPNNAYKTLIDTYGKDESLLKSIPYIKNKKINSKSFDEINSSSEKIKVQNEKIAIKFSIVDFDHFEQRSKHFISSKLSAGTIEFYKNKNSTRINSLYLLNIKAITPINFLTKIPSWRLKIGIDRNPEDNLEAFLSTGIGPSFSLSRTKIYILPSVEISSSVKLSIYSGIQINSDLISLKYENKNMKDHTLTFHKRENANFGYSYTLLKENMNNALHQATLSYYF
jgi:hypothetical protein